MTPRLSAYWANLVTPVPASVAFPIIEGLKSETVCEDDRITTMVPVDPIGFEEAVNSRWRRCGCTTSRRAGPTPACRAGIAGGGPSLPAEFPIRDQQRVTCEAPATLLFDRVRRIGGDVGWYYADLLWRIRGGMDRAIGGVGLRRGRRDPVDIFVGDAIDFWRVEDVIPGERLLLHAEMNVPGDAWLEFRVRPLSAGEAEAHVPS